MSKIGLRASNHKVTRKFSWPQDTLGKYLLYSVKVLFHSIFWNNFMKRQLYEKQYLWACLRFTTIFNSFPQTPGKILDTETSIDFPTTCRNMYLIQDINNFTANSIYIYNLWHNDGRKRVRRWLLGFSFSMIVICEGTSRKGKGKLKRCCQFMWGYVFHLLNCHGETLDRVTSGLETKRKWLTIYGTQKFMLDVHQFFLIHKYCVNS